MARTSKIREELLRLATIHGGTLRPQAVVDAARDESSPLHDSFEWEDSIAAEQWRLAQARQLIRVTVTYEKVNMEEVEVSAFVSLTPDRKKGGDGYRVMTTVLSDIERRAQLLADAKAELRVFREKYRALSELAEVFAAIDSVEETEPVAV